MRRREVPTRRRVRIAALVILAATGAAPASAADPLFLVGAHFGAPTRMSGSAGILLPAGRQQASPVQPSVTRSGVLIDGSAGPGGTRLAAGAGVRMTEGSWILTYGLDLVGTLTRTFDSPRRAAARSTYAGISAGLTLAAFRVTAGVERRVAGPAGPRATVFTWGVGAQIPLGW